MTGIGCGNVAGKKQSKKVCFLETVLLKCTHLTMLTILSFLLLSHFLFIKI